MLFIEFIIGFIVIMVATFGGFLLLAVGAIASTIFVIEVMKQTVKTIRESTSKD